MISTISSADVAALTAIACTFCPDVAVTNLPEAFVVRCAPTAKAAQEIPKTNFPVSIDTMLPVVAEILATQMMFVALAPATLHPFSVVVRDTAMCCATSASHLKLGARSLCVICAFNEVIFSNR